MKGARVRAITIHTMAPYRLLRNNNNFRGRKKKAENKRLSCCQRLPFSLASNTHIHSSHFHPGPATHPVAYETVKKTMIHSPCGPEEITSLEVQLRTIKKHRKPTSMDIEQRKQKETERHISEYMARVKQSPRNN